jgi:SAM-dependent methyltransferase
VFFPGAVETSYDSLESHNSIFLQHYLEAGAGLWEMFWPVALAYGPERQDLLEVGCGFGLGVDMWQRIFGTPVLGVEAAGWSTVGKAALNTPIYQGDLNDVPEIAGRQFGVVYACEVIEHVADPWSFLTSLSLRVRPGGMLALTTPAAEFIHPDQSDLDIITALWPGAHTFLLSNKALGQLLDSAGFPYHVTHTLRERQITYAHHQPETHTPQPAEFRARYVKYFQARLPDLPPGTPIHDGYAYRLHKEQVAGRDWAGAREVLRALEASLSSRFGPDINSHADLLRRARNATTLEQWGETLPFFAISLALHRGLTCLAANQPMDARQWFVTSAHLGREATRINPFFFIEGIQHLWQAEEHLLRIDVKQGELAQALDTLARMTTATDRSHPEFRGVQPSGRLMAESALTVLPRLVEEPRRPWLSRYMTCLEQAATACQHRPKEQVLFSEIHRALAEHGTPNSSIPAIQSLAGGLHARLARMPAEFAITGSPGFKQALNDLAAKSGAAYHRPLGWGGWS